MDINLSQNNSHLWCATYDDYDGAPDALPKHKLHAFATTRREAVEALADITEDTEKLDACREWLWLQV